MEHFDELVCDPRLRRDELLDWVGQMTRDQLYLDRYRVMLTSGSSGRPGLFVYDAGGWRSIAAGFVRTANWCGAAAHRAPPADGLDRRRSAALTSPAREPPPWRSACTGSCPCRSPCRFRKLVEALNQFQPTYLNVYPSIAMWLADEQQAGRLHISPRMLATVAELRTPEMTEQLVRRVRGAALRPLRLHRGALRLRVRAPPRHPPLRGHHSRRERRRRQPTSAGRTARRPTAGHQPAQPSPAADPARGNRHGHPRPRPVPMRAHTDPRQSNPWSKR